MTTRNLSEPVDPALHDEDEWTREISRMQQGPAVTMGIEITMRMVVQYTEDLPLIEEVLEKCREHGAAAITRVVALKPRKAGK